VVNVKRYRCKTSPTSLPALCTGTIFSHPPFIEEGIIIPPFEKGRLRGIL